MNLTELTIHTPFPGKIYYIKKTGSTMDLARRAAESPEPVANGTVFMAGEQTKGRGRMVSRVWDAEPEKNLLFTLLLWRDAVGVPFTAFPLAAGLAAARTLEREGLTPGIKWPNDVLVQGKKICGILCETPGRWISTGIGFNCGQTRFSHPLRDRAVSLTLLTGRPASPLSVLEVFLKEIHRVLYDPLWREELEARLLGMDQEVLLLEGTAASPVPLGGIIRGIGPAGQLLFEPKGEPCREVFAGEIDYGSGFPRR